MAHILQAQNPFDNYSGEEILILDDLREDSLAPADWLKLFDPINSARMSARYRNKLVVPRLVIMSAYMSPKQFFWTDPGGRYKPVFKTGQLFF